MAALPVRSSSLSNCDSASQGLPTARSDAAALSARSLLTRLETQTRFLRDRNTELADRERIFGLALATAQAGVFQFTFSNEAIEWTPGVYEMFDLPQGARLRREDLLAYYETPSLAELERLRSEAIRRCAGFTLDAAIVTPKGKRRWIRLTAAVEARDGVAARLYGMKQDVTEQKTFAETVRRMAEIDALTGLANRAVFETRHSDARRHATGERATDTLLLVDLDGFKQVNDSFGHAFGDERLRRAARRLAQACPDAELVARIGGDEFAVLLGGHLGRQAVERIAAGIVASACDVIEHDGRSVALGASVGVAFAGFDAAWEQFARADAALYAAKAAGKGCFLVFEPAMARIGRRPSL